MKGLILKDLYMSIKYFKSYIFILFLFLVVSIYDPENLFYMIYPCIICSIIPVNLLAYDERSHWDIYCGALPVTRDMVVSAKYLISLSFQGAIFLITAVTQAIRIAMAGSFDLESYQVLLSLLCIVSLFSSSISLPFMFKLGVEKGRLAYYVMIGVICGGSALSTMAFRNGMQANIPFGSVLLLGCVLAAATFAGSWYLSIIFYRKRELH